MRILAHTLPYLPKNKEYRIVNYENIRSEVLYLGDAIWLCIICVKHNHDLPYLFKSLKICWITVCLAPWISVTLHVHFVYHHFHCSKLLCLCGKFGSIRISCIAMQMASIIITDIFCRYFRRLKFTCIMIMCTHLFF